MTIHYVEQGSDQWLALRLGKVTASRVHLTCWKLESGKGWRAERADYMHELAAERLTGNPAEAYVSKDMEIGTLREPVARSEYVLDRLVPVQQIGFIDHPTIPMSGASLDGLVGDNGFIDIKCPKPKTHLGYLRAGVVPKFYRHQINWCFACHPPLQWCDFISFNPDFPEGKQLFVVRVKRDEAKIAELETHVEQFQRELDDLIAEIDTDGRTRAMDQLKASVAEIGA